MNENMLSETEAAPIGSGFPSESQRGEIPVFITKSNYFRVIHVDGFFGGNTPTLGNIMLTVYSHRVPFPETTVIDAVGNEISSKRKSKAGIENEYEASLVMNHATAKALQVWLNNAIRNAEGVIPASATKSTKIDL